MTSVRVERWDTHEVVLQTTKKYDNPFRDTAVAARFCHADSGTEITVDGFYDGVWNGAATWRVRMMPLELGVWEYTTQSPDSDLDGQTGRLDCVAPTRPFLHGPLRAEGHHFRHADGTRRFLISTRFSCQYADPSVWPPVAEHLNAHGINRVLFIMGGVHGIIGELYGDDLDFSRYNLEKFRAIDAFVDTLRRYDILAAPYFYYFNDGAQCGMSLDDDKSYLKYGMSRFGAYCNVMPCLSNQVEGKFTKGSVEGGAYDDRNYEWGNEVGSYMKAKGVFGVPATVHNPLENQQATKPSFYTILQDWQFPWADYMLRQMQLGALGSVEEIADDVAENSWSRGVPGEKNVTWPGYYNPRAFHRQNDLLINLRRFDIPVINEEPGYEMKGMNGVGETLNPKTWNSQYSESLLTTFWTAALAGAYCMWGSLETYCLGNPLPGIKNTVTPQYFKVLQDFMQTIPYWEMEPDNGVFKTREAQLEGKRYRTGFCLSKKGEIYVTYSCYGESASTDLPKKATFEVTRVNPRTGERTPMQPATGGTYAFVLPRGEWVVLFQKTG